MFVGVESFVCGFVGICCYLSCFFFFFFNDTATTEIYTLSLHDALPIFTVGPPGEGGNRLRDIRAQRARSEEHTSELQSRPHLVCRLLLEKKKQKYETKHLIKKKKKKHKKKKQKKTK